MVQVVKTEKPLSEKLEQLITNLRTNHQEKPKPRGQANLYQPFSQERCVICDLVRTDGDSTGLTCGSPKCLLELGVRFMERIGTEKQEELTEKFEEMAKQLGLDPETLPEEIDGLLEAITKEISTIKSTVEEQTKTENTDEEEDSVDVAEAVRELY